MRVFILCTGRCGSMTFAKACGLLDNFTAGHESARPVLVHRGKRYPDQHIEVDNRLSWFLGGLAEEYPDARFVHLLRNRDAVVRSFARGSHILRAFEEVRHARRPDADEAARQYVDTVTANIQHFLSGRDYRIVRIESPQTFRSFLEWVGAVGDIEGSVATFQTVHNAMATVGPARNW